MATIATPSAVASDASTGLRLSSGLAAAAEAVAGVFRTYRAAARAQRQEGLDPISLIAFGRD